MNISKTFSIFKKVDSAIVVSLDFDITLLNVKFKSDLPKVKALKVEKDQLDQQLILLKDKISRGF